MSRHRGGHRGTRYSYQRGDKGVVGLYWGVLQRYDIIYEHNTIMIGRYRWYIRTGTNGNLPGLSNRKRGNVYDTFFTTINSSFIVVSGVRGGHPGLGRGRNLARAQRGYRHRRRVKVTYFSGGRGGTCGYHGTRTRDTGLFFTRFVGRLVRGKGGGYRQRVYTGHCREVWFYTIMVVNGGVLVY